MNGHNLIQIVALGLAILWASRALAASWEDPVPSTYMEGLRGLERRASPMEFTYIRKRSTPLTAQDLFKRLYYEQVDHTFLEPLVVTVAFDSGRIRSRIQEIKAAYNEHGKFQRNDEDVVHHAFDGRLIYIWSGEKRDLDNSILFRHTLESLVSGDRGRGPMFRTEPLRMLGLDLPNATREAGHLGGSLILEGVKRSKQVKGTVASNGLNITYELNDGTIWTFLVDPSLKFLARKFEAKLNPKAETYDFFSKGIGRVRGVAQGPRSHSSSDHLDLPDSLRVTYLDPDDRELYTETYEFSKVSYDPIPEDKFVITDTRPGVAVADGTIPMPTSRSPDDKRKWIEYRIPASPEDLDRTIEFARTGQFRKTGG